ncbi:UPF0545 protein C22orf39 homolog [Leptonychotes weddellii]|uniref:Synaptic plasticity regulator PANTS n=1 Tax=Leptonychotes weddellii TaxID=9713 RepID=A0A7F8Q136_LEPWE|nr:UPF0545 protein C22orf39 homolog [Leptonychotes weddellii]
MGWVPSQASHLGVHWLLSVKHAVRLVFNLHWLASSEVGLRSRPDMADGGAWRPPRPCEAYRAEWKLCRSARHFLHHYYVHGERPACEQWRRDLASCREWEERRSAEAQVHGGAGGGPWAAGVHCPGVRVRGPHPPPHSRPRDTGRGVLPGSLLLLCFLSLEKYQKLVYQRGFQTLKDKERRT